MKYFIKTFGCQQNVADSERIESAFKSRGFTKGRGYSDTNYVVINTCMVREKAENRVYGLVNNLNKIKQKKKLNGNFYKIIVTGCMVGLAFRDKTGKYLKKLKRTLPAVDEFMPIEEVGFDSQPVRTDTEHAWVPISNGCNNFCTFCVVPFTRGREMSRPFEDIIAECVELKKNDYRSITLLGQNVNSYGADLLLGEKNIQVMRDIKKTYFEPTAAPTKTQTIRFNGKILKPIYVKHLGRYRLPTLFPYLLEEVSKLEFEQIDFVSSNPWDFSPELVEVISKNQNINRTIHLPIQSGSDAVLKRMNRWYTTEEYLNLIKTMRQKIPSIRFTTDIIVGFCEETEDEFNSTVALCQQVGFEKAYISMYSERPFTAATKVMNDNVPHAVKKRRWQELDRAVNAQYYQKN